MTISQADLIRLERNDETLTSITLRREQDPAKWKRLIAALRNNTHVAELRFENGVIDDERAQDIADLIRDNRTLLKVIVHSSVMTELGERQLLSAVLDTPNKNLMTAEFTRPPSGEVSEDIVRLRQQARSKVEDNERIAWNLSQNIVNSMHKDPEHPDYVGELPEGQIKEIRERAKAVRSFVADAEMLDRVLGRPTEPSLQR